MSWNPLDIFAPRSRCHGVKCYWRFGWDYKYDGWTCPTCGMLQD